jgi:hypothetical protein
LYVCDMLSLRIPFFSPFRAVVCKGWIDVNLLLINGRDSVLKVAWWNYLWSWHFYTCRRKLLTLNKYFTSGYLVTCKSCRLFKNGGYFGFGDLSTHYCNISNEK